MRSPLVFFLAVCAALPAAPASAVTVETGDINGAKFALARPGFWNKRVLLLAHGFRAPDRPLVADLFPEHLAYRTLLDAGWIVAKTSYRRNGIVVADAIADLDALRDHIVQECGPPDRVLLEGESMGGLIATLIAERDRSDPALYDGAIAIDAALSIQEPGRNIGLTVLPQIPLLFLTNQSELNAPRAYVTSRTRPPGYAPELRPVLFRVARDGHVNVNQRERLVALRALNDWLDHGRDALPRPSPGAPFVDATVAPEPGPSQVAAHSDGHGFDARVVEVSGNYGNVFLNAQPDDFAAAGIKPGTWVELTAHGWKLRVRYGTDFSSVKKGEWVVFPNADGFCWLARNLGDAAATAHLVDHDPVTIRRYDDSK